MNNLSNFFIGCHLSSSKGFMYMGKEALSIGANTFQFFTRNPRGGKAKEIDPKDASDFVAFCKEHHFGKIVAHAPYTLNPCSATPKTREFAEMVFEDDLNRMEMIPNNYYNFHPGSHVGQGADVGIEIIANLLNKLLTPEQTTIVLLETMAGKGTEVGSTFEEINAIIERVHLKDKIGVCLDTCHVSDAGYDLITDIDTVLDEFDKIVGLDKLKALHINDSKNPKGAHKDRHEKIGDGYIGLEGILSVTNNPRLQGLPMVLETPNDIKGYQKEIELLKKLHR